MTYLIYLNKPQLVEDKPSWRRNEPINLSNRIYFNDDYNKLKIQWCDEPSDYIVAVYLVHKFTCDYLVEELKKRPMCKSAKTEKHITKSMESEIVLVYPLYVLFLRIQYLQKEWKYLKFLSEPIFMP